MILKGLTFEELKKLFSEKLNDFRRELVAQEREDRLDVVLTKDFGCHRYLVVASILRGTNNSARIWINSAALAELFGQAWVDLQKAKLSKLNLANRFQAIVQTTGCDDKTVIKVTNLLIDTLLNENS